MTERHLNWILLRKIKEADESLRWRVYITKMALTTGILFGIIAMLSWGVADFFAAKAVRKSGVFRALLWSLIIGLIITLPIFLIFFEFPTITFSTMVIILITAFLGIISLLAFYKGLQVGNVSIVSPISASSVVVTVILSLIILKEKLTSLQAIAISLIIIGAVLTAFKFHDLIKLRLKNIAKGVEYAIIPFFAWGIIYILLDTLISRLGWFLPVFLLVTVEILFLLIYSGATKKDISFPKNVALFVILMGLLEITGFLFIGSALNSEYTTIVAPISAAFPVITIILARIFFKEILELNQKIGIVSVLTGLVLLSI